MEDVNFVIHAAAIKQVDIAEYNPMECIKTNVNGAENIITASITNKVKKVISNDKIFIESLFKSLKSNNQKTITMINNELYEVCLNNSQFQNQNSP